MKTATLLLAAAFVFAAVPPSFAEEGGSTRVSTDDLEEKFYQAFYAENGLRDFSKAAEAYAEVHVAARTVGRKDLAVKALLGRARCTRTMGKPDETKAALAGVLELDPENAEAKAASAADATTTPDEQLRDRMSHLILNGLTGYQGDMATSARELRLLGDRCLPVLAEALGERDLGTVEAASTYLASLESPAASGILVRAMKDPEVLFRSAIAQAVCKPMADGSRTDWTNDKPFAASEVPALSAAADFADAEIRRGVARRLFYLGEGLGTGGTALLLRLATDPDRSVRMTVMDENHMLTLEAMRELVPALRRSLAAEDRLERLRALRWAGSYGDVFALLVDALRPLVRDQDPEVRAQAFAILKGSFTEAELAAMLDPGGPSLAAGAAAALKDRVPWSPGTAAKVREAIERAVRGEFGDEFAPQFLDLVLVGGSPLRQPSALIDLFARTGAPDAQARPRHLGSLRHNILQALSQPLRWDQSPQREQAVAIVEEGVEKCLGSGVVLQQWVAYWSEARVPAPQAWLRAAASNEDRARTAAYLALLRLDPSTKAPLPPDSLPHLARDLVSQDRETRNCALQLAERAPSPALADSLRQLHDSAERANERENLLIALVASAGRAAEDAARADLDVPDCRLTALRLLVNELGVREEGLLDSYVERGGDPGDVAYLGKCDNPPDGSLLRNFCVSLMQAKYTRTFVARAAALLEGTDRVVLLTRAITSADPRIQAMAAEQAGGLRVLELWPRLLPLLESGDEKVRAAAEKALTDLRTYAELKGSLARFGKDEQESAIRSAEALLRSDDAVKRKGAVLALAAIGDRSAIPAILRALDDQDEGVRDAALQALERLGGKAAPR